ncbi:hypothetical protein KY285_003587 [Solanum tuberosum]|nr:hypothetical protein KY285_003587 [Solanum tuberosum]
MKVYNHAHHGYCMRHLGKNLRVNHHCGDSLYLYYNAAKTYSLEEFNNHFVEFKNKIPETTIVLENEIGFEKCYCQCGLENTCSCSEYDLIKILCVHAMTILRSKHSNEFGMSIHEYSSSLLKVEAYLLAYLDSIDVVPLESEWCVPQELLNVKILRPLVDTKL